MFRHVHVLLSRRRRVGEERLASAGFSLVELLVVITIIGILISILLPAVQSAREAARRVSCLSNLRQIGIGSQSYHVAHNCFPVGCADWKPQGKGKQIAWSVFLLPYIEQENIHKLFDLNAAYNAAANRTATRSIDSTYLCPSTNRRESTRVGDFTILGEACTDYGGIFGHRITGAALANGVMIYNVSICIDQIKDGTSFTIMVAEDTGRGATMNGEWANGENIFAVEQLVNIEQYDEIWSDHPGGVNGLFCDGSVHFLNETIDSDTLTAICTRARGDTIDANRLP